MITPCFFGTRPDGMYAATYEITNTCNLSCRHCMNRSGENDDSFLPVEMSLRLIDEMCEAGVRSLYISGGEPLTNPYIDRILVYCSGKGLKLSLATNGTLVEEHQEAIIKNVKAVSISLDGIGKIHDDFRGMEGMYDSVHTAFSILRGKVDLIVSTVIWKGNLHCLEDIVKFSYESGVNQINFSFLVPVGRAIDKDIHIFGEDYYFAKQEVNRIKEKYNDMMILFRRSSRINKDSLECAGGNMIMHVTSTGKIAPCSWSAKLSSGCDADFLAQWEPGKMSKCVEAINRFNNVKEERKKQFGYTGCPAMSMICYNSFGRDDPLNELFKEEAKV